jgi:hypothetical protein
MPRGLYTANVVATSNGSRAADEPVELVAVRHHEAVNETALSYV